MPICPCNELMAELLRYGNTIDLMVDYVRLKLYVYDSLCTYVWLYLIYSYVACLSRESFIIFVERVLVSELTM